MELPLPEENPPDDALDTAPCGYLSFRDDGTIAVVNTTLANLIGYAVADLVGRPLESILTLAARIFLQTHLLPMLRLHGRADEFFVALRARDGDDVPVMLNAVRRLHAGDATTVCALMPVRQRQRYEDEIRAARRAAEEALHSNEALQRTRQALEQQTRELDRQVSRLQQRNDDLAQLSSILAHDLREPTRKITMFASLLEQENTRLLTPNAVWAAETLTAQSLRLSEMLTGLQQYLSVSTDTTPLAPVDLNKVVAAAINHQAGAPDQHTLEVTVGALPTVAGRERELELLFRHLLDNAAKFHTPGVAPRVHIHAEVVQRNSFQVFQDRYRYVDFAQVVVTDNGIGFDEAYRAQIFGALKKLDPKSPGLGMGLAICKKIVDNHAGAIEAHGHSGAGARFTLLLPLEP